MHPFFKLLLFGGKYTNNICFKPIFQSAIFRKVRTISPIQGLSTANETLPIFPTFIFKRSTFPQPIPTLAILCIQPTYSLHIPCVQLPYTLTPFYVYPKINQYSFSTIYTSNSSQASPKFHTTHTKPNCYIGNYLLRVNLFRFSTISLPS